MSDEFIPLADRSEAELVLLLAAGTAHAFERIERINGHTLHRCTQCGVSFCLVCDRDERVSVVCTGGKHE